MTPALFDAVVSALASAGDRHRRPGVGAPRRHGWAHAGLVVSFTSSEDDPDVGVGFGIPLVVRIVLETCTTTGKPPVPRVPIHVACT